MSTTAAPAWRYGNLVAAIATIASCDIAMGFTFQLLPLLMEMQHIPAWIIGLNTAMGPIGILLAGPILPRIISRFGPKRVAYICVVFIMAALALFKLLPSLYVWFPLRFALGIATGALFTISEAWILTFAGAGSRGRVMGIYTSVMAVSFSLGPFALPFTGTAGWLPWLIGITCLGSQHSAADPGEREQRCILRQGRRKLPARHKACALAPLRGLHGHAV